MTLQLHPIALGCMLVVAVGTLIYTYVTTTRQQEQPHNYGRSRGSDRSYPHRSHQFLDFDDIPSTTSSRKSSVSGNDGPSGRRKKTFECTICLGTQKSAIKTLTCKHVFHSHCISTWLITNPSCPICRKEAHL